ncbi:unnamed protein product [Moneuplotes crassus]|uniref:Uncharacterized protein n=1 Tax=Euplotes crassus TaxID=5936 RepID=A0AAD1X4I1_EUPCR|nr:unnamed protein product [Moneuplotes crassus]
MEDLISLRKHQWRIFLKNSSLINCTVNPRNLLPQEDPANPELIKKKMLYYDISLSKCNYIELPENLMYFVDYRLYLQYNCTLFDKKKKEFFGRTLLTSRENYCETFDYKEKLYFRTTCSERILFHLYEVDIEDTILVVEAILNCNELEEKRFSIGFFMIDLVNFGNKIEIINESPRILLDKEGEYYLKRKTHGVSDLLYSIDTKQNMGLINNIVGPNTIYCMRELMKYIDPKCRSKEPDTMVVDEIKELQKCKLILANINMIITQDITREPIKRIELIELNDYLYKQGKIDCDGQIIQPKNKKKNQKDQFPEHYEVRTVEFRATIKLNYTNNLTVEPEYETWKDTHEYQVPLEKVFLRRTNKVYHKFKSTKMVDIDKFQPHNLSALVLCFEQVVVIERVVDEPEKTLDENIKETITRVVNIATLPYIPIVQSEEREGEDEDGLPFKNIVYTLRMVNIDYEMEINPKLVQADEKFADDLGIFCIGTLCQNIDGEAIKEDEDLYERELRMLNYIIPPVIDEEERRFRARQTMTRKRKARKADKEEMKKKRKRDKEIEERNYDRLRMGGLRNRSHISRHSKRRSRDVTKDSLSPSRRRDSRSSRGSRATRGESPKVVIKKEKKYYRQPVDAAIYFNKDQDFLDKLGVPYEYLWGLSKRNKRVSLGLKSRHHIISG